MTKLSAYEEMFAIHLRAEKIECEREFVFHPGRKWRADFRITGTNILVEIDGGNKHAVISSKGKPVAVGHHTRAPDYLKMNEAVLQGFRLFRFLPEQVKSGNAIDTIKRAIEQLQE